MNTPEEIKDPVKRIGYRLAQLQQKEIDLFDASQAIQSDIDELKQSSFTAGEAQGIVKGFGECQRMADDVIAKENFSLVRARQNILSLKPSLEPSEVKKKANVP